MFKLVEPNEEVYALWVNKEQFFMFDSLYTNAGYKIIDGEPIRTFASHYGYFIIHKEDKTIGFMETIVFSIYQDKEYYLSDLVKMVDETNDKQALYNIGQILTTQNDIEVERCLGTKDIIKKGAKIYIGADNLAHHTDGTIQPLGENIEVQGYSVSGLADFIWRYIRNHTPIDEDLLTEYDETSDCVKNAIMDALEELGFYDHAGNRN